MISKLSVENFKSHAQTEIKLNRVTALVGPNGCGKTSLLLAIYYLTQASDQAWQNVFRGNRDSSHLVRRGCNSFRISLSGKGAADKNGSSTAPWELSLIFALAGYQSGTSPHYEPEVKWKLGSESGEKKLEGLQLSNAAPESILQAIGQSAYFKAATQNLALPSYFETTLPQIASDGRGLASVVAYLMQQNPDRHKSIEAALHAIVPMVERVRVKLVEIAVKESGGGPLNNLFRPPSSSVGHELVFDTTSAKEVSAHAMSDGTLLTLGMLTLLWSPAAPQLILLDDIEQGLHPQAQRELIRVLKEFAEKQERQILITSHSPYIIDALSADQVYVMTTDQQGTSVTKRLSDHPDAKRALSVLTTGEFWDAEGESWAIPSLGRRRK